MATLDRAGHLPRGRARPESAGAAPTTPTTWSTGSAPRTGWSSGSPPARRSYAARAVARDARRGRGRDDLPRLRRPLPEHQPVGRMERMAAATPKRLSVKGGTTARPDRGADLPHLPAAIWSRSRSSTSSASASTCASTSAARASPRHRPHRDRGRRDAARRSSAASPGCASRRHGRADREERHRVAACAERRADRSLQPPDHPAGDRRTRPGAPARIVGRLGRRRRPGPRSSRCSSPAPASAASRCMEQGGRDCERRYWI